MKEVNIIEYNLKQWCTSRPPEELCKKDKSIVIGGKFCTELCSNFKGHALRGSSLLCDWECK